jgi:hypothetical protein
LFASQPIAMRMVYHMGDLTCQVHFSCYFRQDKNRFDQLQDHTTEGQLEHFWFTTSQGISLLLNFHYVPTIPFGKML